MNESEVLERIQYFLNFNHWSVYRLAKKSGLPYSSLNNIFVRKTCPTIPTLEKICEGFGISLADFFSYTKNPLKSDTLSFEEQEMVNAYRSLSTRDKDLLKAYLNGLCKR